MVNPNFTSTNRGTPKLSPLAQAKGIAPDTASPSNGTGGQMPFSSTPAGQNMNGFSGGFSSIPNYSPPANTIKAAQTIKNQLPEAAGIAAQNLNALQSTNPLYLSNLTNQMQTYGTPEGITNLEANNANTNNAAALTAGNTAANTAAFEGKSLADQNASREAQQQAGYESNSNFNNMMASPQGAQQITSYLQQLQSGLGANSPAAQYMQQLYGDIMQNYQISQSGAPSPTFGQSLLSAAGPILGAL